MVTDSVWSLDGRGIPAVNHETLAKYLGVRITPRRHVFIPFDIRKAPMKPAQKWRCISEVLIPRMKWVLRLGLSSRNTLHHCDKLVHAALKACAHLPVSTPTAWFYTSQAEGGAGMPQLEASITASIFKAAQKALSSSDVIASVVAARDEHSIQRAMARPPGVMMSPSGVKEYSREASHTFLAGLQLSGLHKAKASSCVGWSGLLRGSKMKGSHWCHAVKLLAGVALCRVNLTYRGKSGAVTCACPRTEHLMCRANPAFLFLKIYIYVTELKRNANKH